MGGSSIFIREFYIFIFSFLNFIIIIVLLTWCVVVGPLNLLIFGEGGDASAARCYHHLAIPTRTCHGNPPTPPLEICYLKGESFSFSTFVLINHAFAGKEERYRPPCLRVSIEFPLH